MCLTLFLDAQQQLNTANLLNNMLGFTRHERLDVKKPGPAISFKPQDAEVEAKVANDLRGKHIYNLIEQRSYYYYRSFVFRNFHSKNEKGLSCDNRSRTPFGGHRLCIHPAKITVIIYIHYYAKANISIIFMAILRSIETWDDGKRVVSSIAEILNLQTYLTFSRSDRHEVSFKVEKNPENKSAADVARLMMDKNFVRTMSRLKGLRVQSAGVGDKVCFNIRIGRLVFLRLFYRDSGIGETEKIKFIYFYNQQNRS